MGKTDDTESIRALYADLLRAWNLTDAAAFVADFADDGEVIGFDGSNLSGRDEIESELWRIFADHKVGTYIGIAHGVTLLTPDVAVLRAIAGVMPAGSSDINPDLNSVQRLTAVKRDGRWHIVLYHNTPAQLHGRPERVEQMTDELRRARGR
jgi:uncharacterized protein (TIGR02246 family)